MKLWLTTALASMSLTTMAAMAFEPIWLPGGDEVRQAVEARRGKTELSKLAASMKPGTWAEVPVEWPGGLRFQAGDVKEGHGLDLGTWSDDGAWDTRTGQFLYLGLRKNRRFFAYSEDRNEWREIKLPEDHEAANSPHIHSPFGHQ